MYPAEQDLQTKPVETKKKKSSKNDKPKRDKSSESDIPASASSIHGPRDDVQEPIFGLVQASISATGQEKKSTGSSDQSSLLPAATGQDAEFTGPIAQETFPPASASSAGTGATSFLHEQAYRQSQEQDISDTEFSGEEFSNVEEGEVSSDNMDELRSFMGWDHIPVFMSSLCGVGVRVRIRVRVNNFFSKTTRPRDMLFFLKDTLSIEDEKLFKACKSVCSSVC